MAKMDYLNKVQQFKNAIDTYSGADPLKPRYEYIMWLEKTIGKENSDVISCLELTLQRFQNDIRYTNDHRFVELLILFTRLKGDKLSYFEKLYEAQLGGKCSIFYKAWSDELVINKKYIEAYDVLKKGLLNNAEPSEILKKAKGKIEVNIGQLILSGRNSCDLLNKPCSCKQENEVIEVPAVKNWEFNSLKTNQVDDFVCPPVIAEPDDVNKCRMYPKHLVYSDREYQVEEIRAFRFYQKLQAESEMRNLKLTPNPPSSFKENNQTVGENDLSAGAQSFTAHTKVALNLVQGMWESPNPPAKTGRFSQAPDSFRIPDVPKAVGATPLMVYNDSILQEPENAGSSRGSLAKSNQKGGGLSERKPTVQPFSEAASGSVDRNVKHQLMFGSSDQDSGREAAIHIGRINEDEELAMCLEHPPNCPSTYSSNQVNDWNLEDITCNTRVFNKFIPIASTPNAKLKEKNLPADQPGCSVIQKDGEVLSIILEASKETPSYGNSSSNNENRPPNILDIEKSLENLELNTSNPFCPKLLETFLLKINYPQNFEPALLQNYYILNTRLPNITKTLKLGNNVYSLTGESFKGAYAKVLKVTCDNQTHALKIEKPSSHWEYYICKEIRRRLNPEQVKYFADITGGYFFQNGSILILNWAKYGTLLNVINQNKLSTTSMEVPVKLFFCIEVLNAIYYLHKHCNIIHADVKPDNFIVNSLPYLSSSSAHVQLIDFGRCIDMRLMPKDTKFNAVVTTDGFQCNEMKENKPWTYQTDLYGLAGTMYCVLVEDYMKVMKKKDLYVFSRPLPRSLQALWNPIFMDLLNIESCDALPDLSAIKKILEDSYNSYDSCSVRSYFHSLNNILLGN